MPQCSFRNCGHIASSLGQLRKHYVEAGHPTKKRRKKAENAPPLALGADAETNLLTGAVALFQEGGTNADADARILRHLCTRYAPQILDASATTDEDDSEDPAS